MTKNRVIGKGNKIPWSFPEDLARFKNLTMGHPVIMGRLTYESIGHPLKNRMNIIVSKSDDFSPENCIVCPNFKAALNVSYLFCKNEHEVPYVIGGSRLYKEALPYATELYITHIKGDYDGDVFFPEYDEDEWAPMMRYEHLLNIDNDNLRTQTYARVVKL